MKFLVTLVIGLIIFNNPELAIPTKCLAFLLCCGVVFAWRATPARKATPRAVQRARPKASGVAPKRRARATGLAQSNGSMLMPGSSPFGIGSGQDDALKRTWDSMSRERDGYIATGMFIEL